MYRKRKDVSLPPIYRYLLLVFAAVLPVIPPAGIAQTPNFLGPLTQGEPVSAKTTGGTGTGKEALSSPVYFDVTQFAGFPDWCAQVSAAYQAAIAVNGSGAPVTSKGVVLDARGFAIGSSQFCASQPFITGSGQTAAPPPVWLMIGPYTVVTSVGWILPTQQHLITGTGDSTGTNGPNTLIQACNGNCGTINPNFPGTSVGGLTLSFTWPHGPGGVFPIGTYGAILYAGAGNSNHGSTLDWSVDAFGGQIRDLSLDCNGVANFAYFTANESENSGIFNLAGRGCNATYGGTASAGAFAFWDRASATGGAGTSHFSADKINYNLGTNVPASGGYGLVYESAKINLNITAGSGSCSTYPNGYPVVNSSGAISGVVITFPGSTCSNGTGTLGCTISSPLVSPYTCTTTVSGGVLTSVGTSGSGSGWSAGAMHGSGPRAFSNWTFSTTGSNTMNGGVLIEGSINPVVHDGHCEYFTGDCVQIGKGTAQTVGGVVRSIYPANAGTGNSVVHLGNNGSGQLMNTLAEDIDMGVSPPTYTLQDDQHLVNLPTGSTAWPHVS